MMIDETDALGASKDAREYYSWVRDPVRPLGSLADY